MLKKILSCVGKYKKYAILAPFMMVIEVVMEVLLPFVSAYLIDVGIETNDISKCVISGILMIVMSLISLCGGALCARFTSIAGTGLAKGLRERLFNKIQDFSFFFKNFICIISYFTLFFRSLITNQSQRDRAPIWKPLYPSPLFSRLPFCQALPPCNVGCALFRKGRLRGFPSLPRRLR